MGDRQDVELDVVGARYIRDYEKDYVKKVEEEIDGDPRIKLHPVTDDPASWYARADVLLFLSVNEVTPLVIAEAGLHGLPSTTRLASPHRNFQDLRGLVLGCIDASDSESTRIFRHFIEI